ncbi:ABC transporter permease [Streptomyces uncialis]|uniref:ABC transporter permease n=1 Tax=Streptomyces uncialis TaxID=1048205 RepID=UPI00365D5B87
MTVSPTAVLHAEWIKLRSLRAALVSLAAVFAVAVAVTALVQASIEDPAGPIGEEFGGDRLFAAFYGVNFAHVAAIAFGTTAMSCEYVNHALRVSLTAVPDRDLFYAAKTAVIGAAALAVGLVTGFGIFLTGQAVLGDDGLGLGAPGALRACFGTGLGLALTALLAAGLTAVLRSGVAALSILIPFFLVVSFVIGDTTGGAAEYLPDRAGGQILFADPVGDLGAWSGLAVAALWSLAALLAGWWTVRRRDA